MLGYVRRNNTIYDLSSNLCEITDQESNQESMTYHIWLSTGSHIVVRRGTSTDSTAHFFTRIVQINLTTIERKRLITIDGSNNEQSTSAIRTVSSAVRAPKAKERD